MKRKNNKAFTITELVIVIAVVAILAAVLIPTFSNVIEKANQSNDTVLVKNLNTALSSYEALNGKPSTMHEALTAVAEEGFLVEKLTPRSSGEILWEQTSNRFVLVKDNAIVFGDASTTANLGYTYWKIVKEMPTENANNYSLYLADGFTTEGALAVSGGIDVGNNSDISINYTNTTSEAQDVVFRTNGGTLTVNGELDTVSHYGSLATVDVQAVAGNSYHEYGTVDRVEVSAGHIELMANSTVGTVYVKSQDCKLTISENANNLEYLDIVASSDVVIEDLQIQKPESVGEVITETPVSSFAGLQEAIGDNEAIGNNKVVFIKITADFAIEGQIDISETQEVTVDFNGHTLTAGASFSGRMFGNYGTLTLKGNGTVDVTAVGSNGFGTVNNFGTLVVVDGTYINAKESNATNFYTRSGGTATFINPTVYGGGGCVASEENTTITINGGYYENETYPAVENRGDMLITAGHFVNTSCSSCDSRWGYAVRSGIGSSVAYLKIQGETEDSVRVTGVQGGLAVVGGTSDIYNGIYETVACEVHTSGASAFYAGYFTGESYETATTIYGGTFKSASKTAILVGNDNPAPDSGAGEESTLIIYGGLFIGGDSNKTAITVDNTEYAIGAASISGGTFSSNPTDFVKTGHTAVEDGDMWKVVSNI